MTPTGQTLAYIVDSAARRHAHARRPAAIPRGSVEALTRQALGWALPLSLLQYWVRGLPAPGSLPAQVERDSSGRLQALTQNGWRVALTYYSDGEMNGRVRRLDLSDGANEIRVVIDTWRSAEAP